MGSAVPVEEMRSCPERVVAMDTVYAPVETPFLKRAKKAGWLTIDGVGMFAGQAERQFRLFTGRPAPEGIMEREARGALAAREATA
jgi:shikimate 5-dehydrogenase